MCARVKKKKGLFRRCEYASPVGFWFFFRSNRSGKRGDKSPLRGENIGGLLFEIHFGKSF